ncbi:MAG: hypothetical protein WD226_13720 [Planctomycetota bacterium]
MLQAAASRSTDALRSELSLVDLPALWVVVLVILPALGFIAWFGYRKEGIGSGLRGVLVGLRLTAFALLALVLARPVWVEQREEVEAPEVVVLIDDSASMQRVDAYAGDADARRALDDATGLVATRTSRSELARAAIARELLPMLSRNGYETELYAFDRDAELLTANEGATGLAALSAEGSSTQLGDALAQVLGTHRGRHVTDMIVVSDGRSNGGLPAREAARAAGAAGIPVHTVVLGDTRPERNVVVELVEAPSDALEGDEIAVTLRVTGRGIEPGTTATVVLEEESVDREGELRPLTETTIALTPGGERVVLIAPPGRTNARTGERRFRARVAPVLEETMTDDNQVAFQVRVSPARMRVLYVEGWPRWEYRFLVHQILLRSEEIQVQCYLLSATPGFAHEASPELPSLTSIPTTREELLANYDVVILGDVNPDAISPDPSEVEAFLGALRGFVTAGGGLLFQASEWNNPRAFANTPLEDLLPVVVDPFLEFQGDTTEVFRPVLQDPSDPHEILRLSQDPEENRRLWETEAGLDGFYWYFPVRRAKPGSQVLLRHPTDREPIDGELYPICVLGYYPSGRTMFLAVDSTYRWRFHYGNRYQGAFWRNAIRWLALGRLKSGDRRFRLETSRATYDLEDRIQFEARVLDADFRPAELDAQRIVWSGADGEEHELALLPDAERDGVYRGGLEVERPGIYRAWIQDEGKRLSIVDFDVRLPSRENADPSPDPLAMQEIADLTGGKFLRLGDIGNLRTELPGGQERREPISSRLEDAWDRWATLLAILGVLSAEWILRKRAELI